MRIVAGVVCARDGFAPHVFRVFLPILMKNSTATGGVLFALRANKNGPTIQWVTIIASIARGQYVSEILVRNAYIVIVKCVPINSNFNSI